MVRLMLYSLRTAFQEVVMMHRFSGLSRLFFFFCAFSGLFFSHEPVAAEDGIPQMPFTKGVNLSSWFEVSSAGQILVNRHGPEDFAALKALGIEVVRLPINLHPMTSGAPDFTIDPLLFEFLDSAIDRAEAAGLYIIIDNHTFNPSIPTEPAVEETLHKVWTQIALRYRDRSDRVLYEILNEPHGISPKKWAAIQGRVIETIRAVDDRHWIVVGGANFNSYNELNGLPNYADDKLLYTFHFYDPFIFTHQGASWTDPPLTPLAAVPFPPGVSPMPKVPQELRSTWVAGSLKNYSRDGSPEQVTKAIDIAWKFAKKRKVPVFCGEFGVYVPNSLQGDRARWYALVGEHLEKRGFSWALWDSFGSFGMFTPGAGTRFESDLDTDVTDALGLNTPVQVSRTSKPLSGPVVLFDDYPADRIRYSGYVSTDGIISLYERDRARGTYAIRMANLDRYNHLGLIFPAPQDMTALVRDGYAVTLYARTTAKDVRFDIRFVNPDAGPDDMPWRISATIDSTMLPPDGEWHRIRIPLSAMYTTGAWKDAWFPDAGNSFDWSRVARFEIVPEHHDFHGMEFLFDDIVIGK